MKGVKHYTEDGEYKGKTHKMNGEVHTGAKHSETSKVESHEPGGPFKMKGYTYPGKSPVKDVDKTINFDVKKKPEIKNTPTGNGDSEVDALITENSSKSLENIKVRDYEKEKADKKTKRAEFFKGLAGQAGMALLETGLQIGATALTTPRNKPSRKGSDTSGFSSIKFGRRS